MELIGQSTKGTMVKPSEIKKLSIYVNGISFKFSPKKTLEFKTADNIQHLSKLLNYSTNEDNFILHFENEINLTYKTDFADNKISIHADLPETIPPIRELSLPIIEDRGFHIGFTEEDNTPVITNGETNFFIALTNEYKLNNNNRKLSIDVIENTPITIMIQDTLVGKGRTAEKWYEQNDNDVLTELETVVSNYINNSFFGWNSRFNSKSGMWTDGNGILQFDEITAISYLSESLLRGSYRTAANLIRTATVNLDANLTAITAPYLGNIVVKGKELISSQYNTKKHIESLLNQNSLEILKIENLINFLQNNNMDKFIEKVLVLAGQYKKEENISVTMYRLNTIVDSSVYVKNTEFNSIITELLDNALLPAVSWLDEGVFLMDDNRINISESFKAGNLLLRIGRILKNDFYTVVGGQMITSVLSKSNELGFLPEIITTKDNRIVSESGSLLPEDFYFDLTKNPYYLKQESLAKVLGKGSWILTSSKFYEIKKNDREISMTFNFPKGSIHHFAIKGVKPFNQIFIHQTKFNSDPNFQRYSDGWVYDRLNQTLYIKLKHRVDNELIKILYYNPEQEDALAAEVVEATEASSESTDNVLQTP